MVGVYRLEFFTYLCADVRGGRAYILRIITDIFENVECRTYQLTCKSKEAGRMFWCPHLQARLTKLAGAYVAFHQHMQTAS
ncbi:hypothetical protein SBA1_550116 [Candidatus Sulfotelmatobacter kueseliae]|uniref:Uncharacterized protein n=1 Tax=Candidatus Sulfotelmatobacter kueseliae TaxID=2042962 RepID=A0A2U3KYL7_9BACT|nr:hypothetical protein SBA1_550116 [Candidatus Sulfotelmatobacter kueseliae]